MMTRLYRTGTAAIVLALLSTACGTDAGDAVPEDVAHATESRDYYSDVRPILVEHCMGCHTGQGIGWSMEDPVEAFGYRHAIAQQILERRMPPWLAEPGHQSYQGDLSLGDDVLRLVADWQAGGFALGEPRADSRVDRAEGHGGGIHTAVRNDVSVDVLPDGSYLPDQSRTDEYRCFVVDWPHEEPGYVTGFRALPGNLLVAHHAVVYAVSPAMADRFVELTEAEEGAGYQCFGGALPDRLGQRAEREAYETRYPGGVNELNRSNFWLSHWAPGMDGHRFPEGTGILVEPGSVLVVQMHYYSAEAPGDRDANTRLEFEIEREVERPAFHLPQTRNDWLAGDQNGAMVIAPGEMATYGLSDRLGDILPYVSRVTKVAEDRIVALEVHAINLHMHAFGHSGRITLEDRHGRVETLLSVPRWDLSWQRDFTLMEPRIFPRADLARTSLAVECTFENTRTEPVYGGFGSFDEMCFNFAYIAVQTGDES